MKFIFIFLLFTFLFLSSCDTTDSTEPPAKIGNGIIEMQVGDKWLYRDYMVNLAYQLPDTIMRYTYLEAVKDTQIDNSTYIIIEGFDYDVNQTTVDSAFKRFAITINDSECVAFEFLDDDGVSSNELYGEPFGFNLNRHSSVDRNIKQKDLRYMFFNNVKLTRVFDTDVFYDKVYPLQFPLVKDSAWYFRREGDDLLGVIYRKKYLGNEILETPIDTIDAIKCEMLVSEALNMPGLVYFQWYGKNGMVKTFIDFGENLITDSGDSIIDSYHTYNVIELIGHEPINSDTLSPWGNDNG